MSSFPAHEYQREAARFLVERQRAGLFLDPGLGKTGSSLLAIQALRRLGLFERGLIVAPLRVASEVWPAEVAKWSSFSDLRVSVVHGTPKARAQALEADAELFAINPEGVHWLADHWLEKKGKVPEGLSTLFVDESTRFKTWSSRCSRSLRKILPLFASRVILTGTPAANSVEELYHQIYILDEGARLGRNISAFRSRWFYRGGYQGREWKPFPTAQKEIEGKIADLVFRLDGRDWLELPELVENDILVELPPKVHAAYKKLERALFFELENGEERTALSGASKYAMCRQVANGGLYYAAEAPDLGVRPFETLHSAKLEALESLVEELSGKPLMVAYQFKHDLERLLKWRKAPAISGGVTGPKLRAILEKWNKGEIPLLYCQPQAMSHGLNMQGSCNDLAWLGLPDDLDVYLQTNARIFRQGAKGPQVRIHRILARGTVDLAIRRRLETKDGAQRSLLDSLREWSNEQRRTWENAN